MVTADAAVIHPYRRQKRDDPFDGFGKLTAGKLRTEGIASTF